MVALEKASTCRSKGTKGGCIGKVYDNVIACNSLKGKISQIAQEVVAGIKKKASAQDDAKATAQRTAGQRVKQNWHCSQIENEEEEEEEERMGRQWEEDEKLEEFLE